jgi:hypothetical protein
VADGQAYATRRHSILKRHVRVAVAASYRHSRESGNPFSFCYQSNMDSRFCRNDDKGAAAN